MSFKKGDTIKVIDKDLIFLGFDLTNDKEYKVDTVLPDGSFVVMDDENDVMVITVEEAKFAVEKVETKVKEENNELQQLFDKFIEEVEAAIRKQVCGCERKHDEPKRKQREIKIDMRNLARKTIIEEAKRFIEKQTDPDCYVKGKRAVTYRTFYGVIPEFHVNKKKRAVTVLLRGAGDGEILGKGVARCAESDVFNENLGKAIALGRAFNINVDKFINAAQPGTVAVGQEFITGRGIEGKITRMDPAFDSIFGTAFRHTHDHGWLGEEQVEIIDDTEAIYE